MPPAKRPRHWRHGILALLAFACGRPATSTEKSPNAAENAAQNQGETALTPENGALPLIPAPQSATRRPGAMRLTAATRVTGPEPYASALAARLGLSRGDAGSPSIALSLDAPFDGAEAFEIVVTPAKATVRAHGDAGLAYGVAALAALATPAHELPCVTIFDAPRYPFRAMHLDVARHFFDRATVERYLDLLALYRFNVFHWHLTDDQGFRLRLASHPELASADGSYSADDIRHVVEYAKARHIEVIPEIEMPGHSRAILAAHPELSCTGKPQPTPRTWGIFEDVLCAGNPGSYDLVHDILAEVATLFPSRYVHVGGDEVPDARWNACPKCRAAMKAAGVDAAGLENVFMARIFAELAKLGKEPFVWDEALPPATLANGPNPTIVAWQSPERGQLAASRGFDTVCAPYQSTYFNFTQSTVRGIEPGHQSHILTWEMVHGFSPGDGPHVRGGEGCLWTEYVTTPEDIETLAMPRMAALAEALWSGKHSAADFATRFTMQRPTLDAMGVHYFIDPPEGLRLRTVILDDVTATLEKPPLYLDGVIRYTRDGTTPTAASPRYRDPLLISGTTTLTTALFLPNGRASPPVHADFVKSIPRPADPNTDLNARCTYYEGKFHRLADLDNAVPLTTVSVAAIDLPSVEKALGGKMAAEHFALTCDGPVRVPAMGVLRVSIEADDGLRVTIDGQDVVAIDEELGPRRADGDIALAAGLHRMHVVYFQGTEGMTLDIRDQAGRKL